MKLTPSITRTDGTRGGPTGASSTARSDVKSGKTNQVTLPRISAPLFVPASRDGKIAEVLKKEEERLAEITGWRYRVVEQGGKQLRSLLTKSNIYSKEKCERESCMACIDMGKPFDCRRRGAVYETTCLECSDEDGGGHCGVQ